MSAPILEIHNLTVDLPEGADRQHAVSDVSVELHHNEILCLVGESGSGKSITSRAIMGLLARGVRASAGRILFRGEDLLRATPRRLRELRGSHISMIFQEPMTALNPVKRVGDQVDEVIAVHTATPKAKRLARIIELFDAVQLPEPLRLLRSYPHQLSGGQRQRAMIAMALALEPAILIADEPTTALDVTTQAQILALIKGIQAQRHMGVLFITHDFGVVSEIADRVAVMQSGSVVEFGGARQVLGEPRHPYTRSLIASIPSLVPPQRKPRDDPRCILSTVALRKSYRSGAALLGGKGRIAHAAKDVNLTIHRGETLGLVGESGSGKSTVARCIARLVDADDGRILLGDIDLVPLSRRQLRPYRRRIQMVFQDPYGSLNPRRTVGKLIAEGPMVHGMSEAKAMAKASELLELVGLDHRALGRYPHEFSGGQRQRIGIARALALEPEVLVADEPVSALDVSIQAQVLKLLADIRDRLDLTMLFITHDLRVAAQVCDSIAVMRFGEIVEYGRTREVYSNPRHAYTRELLAAVPGKGMGLIAQDDRDGMEGFA
ncbi:MAG TPA: ABC transporter ATP-binding protein [Casimicrobiaceae bacterium]|nr:ABC transporter ATP-binding protein [Casimicrobiaceae bacterium]